MAMKLLEARALPNATNPRSLRLVVHIDTSKLVDGEPDPQYVRRFTWGYDSTKDGPKAAFITRCKAEAKLLCQVALDRMAPEAPTDGEAVAGEGAGL